MTETIDLLGIGNAIADNLCRSSDSELKKNGLIKGSMALIDAQKAAELQSTVIPVSRQSGGSVSNSVVHFAQLGGQSQFIGKVANDDAGTHYIDELIREGVEYSTSFLKSGISTGRCYVFVTSDGQRTMCTYLGASSELSIADVDTDALDKTKILFIEGYLWASPCAKEMILESVLVAKKSESIIAFSLSDPFLVDGFRSEFQNFVEKDVDILIGNDQEVYQLYETSTLQDSIEELKNRVNHFVITRGERGSVAVVQHDVFKRSATPIEQVVDTTGAGDAFAGGYLYGLTQNYSVEQCLEIASNRAGQVIGHFGGRN